MQHIDLGFEADFDGWRAAARRLAAERVAPGNVVWTVADRQRDLFAPAPVPDRQAEPPAPAFTVPRAFVTLAADAICHSDRERFALLYALLWRLHEGERSLLEIASDPLVARVSEMAKSVRRDQHKMRPSSASARSRTRMAGCASCRGSSRSTSSWTRWRPSSPTVSRRCAGRS